MDLAFKKALKQPIEDRNDYERIDNRNRSAHHQIRISQPASKSVNGTSGKSQFLTPPFDESRLDFAMNYYERLNLVATTVFSDITAPIRQCDVAASVFMSTSAFGRYFRDKTGTQFKTWTTFVRIQRAIDLLCASDISITELAGSVGFADVRTFQRAFKRFTGRSPANFRKSLFR